MAYSRPSWLNAADFRLIASPMGFIDPVTGDGADITVSFLEGRRFYVASWNNVGGLQSADPSVFDRNSPPVPPVWLSPTPSRGIGPGDVDVKVYQAWRSPPPPELSAYLGYYDEPWYGNNPNVAADPSVPFLFGSSERFLFSRLNYEVFEQIHVTRPPDPVTPPGGCPPLTRPPWPYGVTDLGSHISGIRRNGRKNNGRTGDSSLFGQ